MSYANLCKPGDKVRLSNVDPLDHGGMEKEVALAMLAQLGTEISDLQDLLFSAGQNGLLIVFQGRDTSGKDGSINRLLSFVNVQSTRVTSFKQPTSLELAHDFLWRVHPNAPPRGGVSIFNRSHYEDVVVARVHDLVPKKVWKRRFDQINEFESLLAESGTIVIKFYLHITKGEQERRLLEREKEVDKAWKLNVGDWKEREFWDEYTDAYEDALTKCTTEECPWYIVPANHKWFRDLAIAQTIVNTLRPYRKAWHSHLQQVGEVAKAELEAYRKAKA